MHALLTIEAYLASLWFLLLAFLTLRSLRTLGLLSAVDGSRQPSAPWPKVSVIVPACNEEATIEPAARSLLTMDYPNLELIFLDDRSADSTGRLLDKIAADDPRARVEHITELPEGWLGKTHALERGAAIATGSWLLFTDADVRFGPLAVRKAIAHCEQEELDFLAVLPRMTAPTRPLAAVLAQLFHGLSLGYSAKRIAAPEQPDAVGTGAFGLARRSFFERSGAFATMKMEVLDDGCLAYLMKRAGAKLGVLCGIGEVELEWYPSLAALARGVEKNGFALFQYSALNVLAYTIGIWALFALTLALPLLSRNLSAIELLAGALLTYLSTVALQLRRLIGLPASNALSLPLTFPLVPFLFLSAAYVCLKQSGIFWRRKFYPLAELRSGQRLKLVDMLLRREP